jgi:hypothetical protein
MQPPQECPWAEGQCAWGASLGRSTRSHPHIQSSSGDAHGAAPAPCSHPGPPLPPSRPNLLVCGPSVGQLGPHLLAPACAPPPRPACRAGPHTAPPRAAVPPSPTPCCWHPLKLAMVQVPAPPWLVQLWLWAGHHALAGAFCGVTLQLPRRWPGGRRPGLPIAPKLSLVACADRSADVMRALQSLVRRASVAGPNW